MAALERTYPFLCYINGTWHLSIMYLANAPGGIIPSTYVDVDFAACVDTWQSTIGILTMMAGGPTFWMAKWQDIGALSTTEAEYIVLAKGAQQAQWVRNFLSEIGHEVPLPSRMLTDNQELSSYPKIPSSILGSNTLTYAIITFGMQLRTMKLPSTISRWKTIPPTF